MRKWSGKGKKSVALFLCAVLLFQTTAIDALAASDLESLPSEAVESVSMSDVEEEESAESVSMSDVPKGELAVGGVIAAQVPDGKLPVAGGTVSGIPAGDVPLESVSMSDLPVKMMMAARAATSETLNLNVLYPSGNYNSSTKKLTVSSTPMTIHITPLVTGTTVEKPVLVLKIPKCMEVTHYPQEGDSTLNGSLAAANPISKTTDSGGNTILTYRLKDRIAQVGFNVTAQLKNGVQLKDGTTYMIEASYYDNSTLLKTEKKEFIIDNPTVKSGYVRVYSMSTTRTLDSSKTVYDISYDRTVVASTAHYPYQQLTITAVVPEGAVPGVGSGSSFSALQNGETRTFGTYKVTYRTNYSYSNASGTVSGKANVLIYELLSNSSFLTSASSTTLSGLYLRFTNPTAKTYKSSVSPKIECKVDGSMVSPIMNDFKNSSDVSITFENPDWKKNLSVYASSNSFYGESSYVLPETCGLEKKYYSYVVNSTGSNLQDCKMTYTFPKELSVDKLEFALKGTSGLPSKAKVTYKTKSGGDTPYTVNLTSDNPSLSLQQGDCFTSAEVVYDVLGSTGSYQTVLTAYLHNYDEKDESVSRTISSKLLSVKHPSDGDTDINKSYSYTFYLKKGIPFYVCESTTPTTLNKGDLFHVVIKPGLSSGSYADRKYKNLSIYVQMPPQYIFAGYNPSAELAEGEYGVTRRTLENGDILYCVKYTDNIEYQKGEHRFDFVVGPEVDTSTVQTNVTLPKAVYVGTEHELFQFTGTATYASQYNIAMPESLAGFDINGDGDTDDKFYKPAVTSNITLNSVNTLTVQGYISLDGQEGENIENGYSFDSDGEFRLYMYNGFATGSSVNYAEVIIPMPRAGQEFTYKGETYTSQWDVLLTGEVYTTGGFLEDVTVLYSTDNQATWVNKEEVTDYQQVTHLKMVTLPGKSLAQNSSATLEFPFTMSFSEEMVDGGNYATYIQAQMKYQMNYPGSELTEAVIQSSKLTAVPIEVNGTVFRDRNGNEVRDAEENDNQKPYTLKLYHESSGAEEPVKTITTDAKTGAFSFGILLPGTYTLHAEKEDEEAYELSSFFDRNGDYTFTLTAGEERPVLKELTLGIFTPRTMTVTPNRVELFDEDAPVTLVPAPVPALFAGEEVQFVSADPSVATVDSNGVLRYAGPGETSVTIKAPQLSAAISLGADEWVTATVPVLCQQRVSGTIFLDKNGNEIRDAQESDNQKTYTLKLYPAGKIDGEPIETITTDSETGFYSFGIRMEGSYTLHVEKEGDELYELNEYFDRNGNYTFTLSPESEIPVLNHLDLGIFVPRTMTVTPSEVAFYDDDEPITIIPTLTPELFAEERMDFASADPLIAEVDANGILRYAGPGQTSVTVKVPQLPAAVSLGMEEWLVETIPVVCEKRVCLMTAAPILRTEPRAGSEVSGSLPLRYEIGSSVWQDLYYYYEQSGSCNIISHNSGELTSEKNVTASITDAGGTDAALVTVASNAEYKSYRLSVSMPGTVKIKFSRDWNHAPENRPDDIELTVYVLPEELNPPIFVVVPESPDGENGWYITKPQITLLSGVTVSYVDTCFREKDEDFRKQTITERPEIPGSGIYQFEAYNTVDLGNGVSVSSVTVESPVIQVDLVNPTICKGLTYSVLGTKPLEQIGRFLTFGNCFKEALRVEFRAEDEESGVGKLYYTLPGQATQSKEIDSDGRCSFDIPLKTNGQITYYVTDKAGNKSDIVVLKKDEDSSSLWVVEDEGPVWDDFVLIGVDGEEGVQGTDGNLWFPDTVNASVSVTDEDSGLASASIGVAEDAMQIQFPRVRAVDDMRETSATLFQTVEEEGICIVMAEAEDNARNVSNTQTLFGIDRTAPKLILERKELVDDSPIAVVHIADEESGIDGNSIQVLWREKSIPYRMTPASDGYDITFSIRELDLTEEEEEFLVTAEDYVGHKADLAVTRYLRDIVYVTTVAGSDTLGDGSIRYPFATAERALKRVAPEGTIAFLNDYDRRITVNQVITLDLNGNTLKTDTPGSAVVVESQGVLTVTDSGIEGKVFGGELGEAAFTVDAGAKLCLADGTIYCGYIGEGSVEIREDARMMYLLTYQGGETSEESPEAHYVQEGKKGILKANTFTAAEGYAFRGWMYEEQIYQAGEDILMPGRNIKVMAKWLKIEEPDEEPEPIVDARGKLDGVPKTGSGQHRQDSPLKIAGIDFYLETKKKKEDRNGEDDRSGETQ